MLSKDYESRTVPCPACGSLQCREILYRPSPTVHLRAAAVDGKAALEGRAARPGDPLLECKDCHHRWGDAVTRVP